MNASVLLVDDDIELAGMLQQYLQREAFDVHVVHDGDAGIREAVSGRHDIAVLDVTMPGRNGIETLGCIRRQCALPVLMLTARGDDADRIIGLELGADDYVPKPCTPRELTARIRAILRRSHEARQDATTSGLTVGDISIRPEERRAERAGKALDLTSTEFDLLVVLARHAGRAVSNAELSRLALDRPLARFDRSIAVHMSSIRHKLGTLPDGRSCIQTVYRKGYQLIRM